VPWLLLRHFSPFTRMFSIGNERDLNAWLRHLAVE
jgi:hypothetical protein